MRLEQLVPLVELVLPDLLEALVNRVHKEVLEQQD